MSAYREIGVSAVSLGVNCGQQGPMESYALARGMVALFRFRFGFHGCFTAATIAWHVRTLRVIRP